jgi:EAL domain-containing protein (putative c-di-GMP-specific phosphodiesterase class I)
VRARACLRDRILRPGGLSVRFQPIVESDEGGWRVQAVEGLVRGPRGSTLERAEILFDYVRRKRDELAVDRACVRSILSAAAELPTGIRLSINVHALTLARDAAFVGFVLAELERQRIAADRLTVEIVEHARPWSGPALLDALHSLRQSGISVALDDFGQGESNLRMIVDCRPDYLKIDACFVRGVEADPYRRAVLQSAAALGTRIGARVIAEGIERESELDVAVASGISLFQGFLFSPPLELRQPLLGRSDWATPRRAPQLAGGVRCARWMP